MTIDERVRDALHAYADPIEPAPGSWERIEARLDDRSPKARRSRGPLVLAAVGVLVIVALIGAAVLRDRENNVATDQVAPSPTLPKPADQPPQRVLVLGTTTTGGGSMVILPSASKSGVGDMGSAYGIRGGAPVAVTPDGHFAYVVRKSVNSTCGDGDSIFRQPIGSGARSGDEIANATAPTVSADGRHLAYMRCAADSTGDATVVLRDLADGSEREVHGRFDTRILQFAADGRHVLVDGEAASALAVQPRELDLVGGEPAPGRAIPAASGVEVVGYWGSDALLAIDHREASTSVVTASLASGEVREKLFDATDLDGAITNVIPNITGNATLVVVDGSKLFWWAPGMPRPQRLDDSVLGAAWMPDQSSPTSASSLPNGIAAVRGDELVVLGATDGAQHSSLGTVDPGTVVAPSADGRTWALGASSPESPCDYSKQTTPPALERLDTTSGRREPIAGGAYAPAINHDDVVAFGYACDGNGMGLTNLRTRENFRTDPLPASNGESSPTVRSVHPLGWSPDGRRLLYFADVGGTQRLFVARFAPEFFVGAQDRDREITEVRSPAIRTAAMAGNDTVVAALQSDPTVLVEYRNGGTLTDGRRLVKLPASVTSIVADPTGRDFLIVTAERELWRWTRGQSGPAPLATDVTSAAWIPWS